MLAGAIFRRLGSLNRGRNGFEAKIYPGFACDYRTWNTQTREYISEHKLPGKDQFALVLSPTIWKLIRHRSSETKVRRLDEDDMKSNPVLGTGRVIKEGPSSRTEIPSGLILDRLETEVDTVLIEKALAFVRAVYPDIGTIKEAAKENVKFFLRMGATPSEVGEIFKCQQGLLQRSRGRLRNAAAVIEKAAILGSFGLRCRTFVTLCLFPSGLLTSAPRHLKGVLQFLVEEVQVKDLEQALLFRPILLRFTHTTLRKRLQNFQLTRDSDLQQLHMDPLGLLYDSSKMLQGLQTLRSALGDTLRFKSAIPSLLCLQPEVLVSRIVNFKEVTGWKDADHILRRFPKVLIAREFTLRDAMKFFEDMFEREAVLRELRKQPDLLGFKASTLKVKAEFVTETMGRSKTELLCHLQLLAVSLERRLKPRYELLRAVDPLIRPPLRIFAISEVKFATYMKNVKLLEDIKGDNSLPPGEPPVLLPGEQSQKLQHLE